MGLVIADGFYRRSLFPSDNQRPSNLVIAVLAPAAHRPDRRAVWKSRHYDAEIPGALGTASGDIFRHLGYMNGFHMQAREQNAHHRKSLETRRTLATALEQFDSLSCQIVNPWLYRAFPLARLTNASIFI